MGLIEEAQALDTPFLQCHLEKALLTKPELADEVIELIAKQNIRASVVSTVLGNHGIPLGPHVVTRHRRGMCVWCTSKGRFTA